MIVATIWDEGDKNFDARNPGKKVAEIRAELPVEYIHPNLKIIGLDKFVKLINELYAGPYIDIAIYEEITSSRIIQAP